MWKVVKCIDVPSCEAKRHWNVGPLSSTRKSRFDERRFCTHCRHGAVRFRRLATQPCRKHVHVVWLLRGQQKVDSSCPISRTSKATFRNCVSTSRPCRVPEDFFSWMNVVGVPVLVYCGLGSCGFDPASPQVLDEIGINGARSHGVHTIVSAASETHTPLQPCLNGTVTRISKKCRAKETFRTALKKTCPRMNRSTPLAGNALPCLG